MLTSYDDNKTVQQDKKIILCQREMKIHISGFDGISKFGVRSPIHTQLHKMYFFTRYARLHRLHPTFKARRNHSLQDLQQDIEG